MTFTALPAAAQRTGCSRVFIERGGKVYFGYQNLNGVNNGVRLNMVAANAVFAPLGLPPIRPVTRASDFSTATAATLATAKGAWGLADGTSAVVLRFGDGGRFVLGGADVANAQQREQTGAELGHLDIDPATGRYAALLDVDSNLTGGTSHPDSTDTLTIAADKITTGEGLVITRMPGTGSGIVGLWALGSATDLSVQHFAFFANGKVLMIDNSGDTSGGQCTVDRQGPPGAL